MAYVKAIWKKLGASTLIPVGRSSHSLNVIGQKAYVFSGEHSPRIPIDNKLMEYDISREIWREIPTKGHPPCPRVAHATVSMDDKLFVFGGRAGIAMGENSFNDMHCFDSRTEEWHLVECTGQIPEARSFHAMTPQKNKFFMFGGCVQDGRMNDLYEFDTYTSAWKKLQSYDAIAGRGGPGLAAVNDSVYVVSGFAGHEVNDMYKFDTSSSTWSTLNPQPNFSPRSVFGTSVLGQSICIFGGEVAPSAEGHAGAGKFTNETYCYNTQAPDDGWQRVETEGSAPTPRGWLQTAAVSDRELLVFGGNSDSNERLNDIYLLQFV